MAEGPPLKPAGTSGRRTNLGVAPSVPREPTERARTVERAASRDSSVPLSSEAAALVRTCAEELARNPEPHRAARLHLEIARAHESAGALAEAARHYERALTGAPDNLAAIRGSRRVHLARGRYQAALPLYDAEIRVVSDVKRRARLHYEKGRLLEDRLLDPGRAMEAYQQSFDLDPQNPSALKALEQLQTRGGRWDELTATYERTANAVPDDARHRAAIVSQRAHLLESQHSEESAAAELYETALSLEANDLGALEALERLYQKSGEWRRLIAVLDRIATQSADPMVKALALYRAARVYAERLGSREEAVQSMARAARAAPGDPLVLENLARLYQDSEMFVSLVGVLRALVDSARERGEQVSLLHSIGVIQDLLGREEEAIASLHAALELDPTHVPVLQALGKLYSRRGAWMELISMHMAEAAASPDPERAAAAHARIAETFELRLARPMEAAEHHARALTLVPGYPASFKALTRLYAHAGEYRRLVELHERALDDDLDEGRRIAHLFKIGGLWEDRLDDPVQAAYAYRRVLELKPEDLGALQALQRVTERAERWEELVEVLEREADLTDDRDLIVSLLHRSGTVLEEQLADRDGALVRFRRILELKPTFVPALSSLGRIYYRAGRWDDLLEMYQRELDVTAEGRASAALLQKMGELCEQRLGRDDQAIEFYRGAVEHDSTYRPALRALARLLRERADWQSLVEVLELEQSGLTDPRARAITLYRAGEVYEEHLGDRERAASCYEGALQGVEGFRPAATALLRLRAETRDWNRLVRDISAEAAATSDPERAATVLLRQGEILRDQLQAPERAIECFEAVLDYDGGRLQALLALEGLYARVGAWERLAEIYRREAGVFADPGARLAALREYARLLELRGLGEEEELISTYQQIVALDPADEAALASMERIARTRGDRELLVEVYTRMAQTAEDPVDAATHFARLGQVLEEAGDGRALEAYQSALHRDAENLAAIRGFGRLADLLGNAHAMAEAARLEAAVTRNGEAIAQHLVRSAVLRLERLDDPEGAMLDLERALEAHPEDEHAAERITAPMLAAGRDEHLVDVLSRAAGSSKSKERKTALWLRVAELQSERLGDVGAGIAALKRGLAASAEHVPSLRKLAALYQLNEQWHDAVGALEEVLELAEETDIICETQLELAKVFDEQLDDFDRAVEAVEKVLGVEPGHAEALDRLVDFQLRAGEKGKAAATARRLADSVTDSPERAAALIRAAGIERERGESTAAEDALTEALATEGSGGEAARVYKEIIAETGSWVGYAAGLAAHVQRADRDNPEYARSPAIAAVYLELARTYGEGMGLPKKALETLEDGIRATSGDQTLVMDLVQRLCAAGQFDDALTRLHHILVTSPTRADTWEQFARTFEQAGRPIEAMLAREPLNVLGTPNSDSGRSRLPRPAGAAPGTFGPEALTAVAVDRANATLAADLLASVAEAVGKIHPPEFDRLGVSRRDKITARMDHPIRVLVDRVADIFAVECDLYEHPLEAPLITVEPTETPSLIVGARFGGLPRAQQVFLLGWAISAIAGRFHAAEKLSSEDLRLVLNASTRSVVPDFGVGTGDEDTLEALGQRIKKAVPRRWRRAMEMAAAEYATAPLADVSSWKRALRQTALRAALVLCDDLRAGVEALRRLEGRRDLAGPALVEASPSVADLMLFWVSEPAMHVRRRAGILGA